MQTDCIGFFGEIEAHKIAFPKNFIFAVVYPKTLFSLLYSQLAYR
jgi:hypothetical protein